MSAIHSSNRIEPTVIIIVIVIGIIFGILQLQDWIGNRSDLSRCVGQQMHLGAERSIAERLCASKLEWEAEQK